jgi:outer membrane biosynthesis protein TonB
MFTDLSFRIAFAISLVAHIAVIAPAYLTPANAEKTETDMVELNYIIINDPAVAAEEEVYSDAKADKNITDTEEKELSTVAVMDSQSPEEMRRSFEASEIPPGDQEEREKAYLEYYNVIREKIRSRVHSSGWSDEEGMVKVIFTLSRDGRLVNIHKAVSSLTRNSEISVIRAIMLSRPFPPFPEELGKTPITFSLAIKFASP